MDCCFYDVRKITLNPGPAPFSPLFFLPATSKPSATHATSTLPFHYYCLQPPDSPGPCDSNRMQNLPNLDINNNYLQVYMPDINIHNSIHL